MSAANAPRVYETPIVTARDFCRSFIVQTDTQDGRPQRSRARHRRWVNDQVCSTSKHLKAPHMHSDCSARGQLQGLNPRSASRNELQENAAACAAAAHAAHACGLIGAEGGSVSFSNCIQLIEPCVVACNPCGFLDSQPLNQKMVAVAFASLPAGTVTCKKGGLRSSR